MSEEAILHHEVPKQIEYHVGEETEEEVEEEGYEPVVLHTHTVHLHHLDEALLFLEDDSVEEDGEEETEGQGEDGGPYQVYYAVHQDVAVSSWWHVNYTSLDVHLPIGQLLNVGIVDEIHKCELSLRHSDIPLELSGCILTHLYGSDPITPMILEGPSIVDLDHCLQRRITRLLEMDSSIGNDLNNLFIGLVLIHVFCASGHLQIHCAFVLP